ncbi:extracellular matrix glycoprotein pherophorin-V28 [Volvox carteri f. nagariensis]|uniref:Extracellular matrix glycoprotein pherophorin-V28 n=1 Tax=Volvox carteri f. nagariensis TaxID=3068 RepID=D8UEQ9_VOLCA|nr:extracellular matrix glycoprotein pherophorin-V28 [Volvox carteri f. nagariensis]EFJ41777.1 extracellular matrix glycoprotein pherophorin-V28 [Volvox carteri f. nagariensis]|eukprot:XP_002957123.1 extracellular matrix glycoprotein pherophorin-V28 [Volvox carteri f. nagariensis]
MTKCSSSCSSSVATAIVLTTSVLLLFTPTAAAAASADNRLANLRGIGSIKQQQQLKLHSSTFTLPSISNCERDAAKSPLRLSFDAAASGLEFGGTIQRYCFRIRSTAGCSLPSRCCGSSSRTASKIEFDVVAGCKDSLRHVTVNGQPAVYEYDTALSMLRVTDLNAPTSTIATAASDTQVCVLLDTASSCPSLATFCGRHDGASTAAGACRYSIFSTDGNCCPISAVSTAVPLPLPASTIDLPSTTVFRSDFPYCQCQRNAAGSRLFAVASLDANPNVDNGLTRICFDVGLHDVCADPTSKCCEFTLYKMELEVDRACADALAYTTIDGIQHVRYFQTAPHAAIKIVNLDRPLSAVNGTQVCLFLRPECNTLEKLCAFHDGSCTVGLFSKPGTGAANCCPLSSVRI